MKSLLIACILVVALIFAILLGFSFYLAPKDKLEKAGAIVAVSGGDTAARAREAIELYQEGWAPLIIFSGAASDPDSPSNAQVMRNLAIEAGIPPDVITLDEHSLTTKQNANEVASLVSALGIKSIILVTSPYHQRRAYIEFRDTLSPEVKIINHPAIDQTWGRKNWWLTPAGWYLTLTEGPKTLFAELIQ